MLQYYDFVRIVFFKVVDFFHYLPEMPIGWDAG
jgi:hypothetical protein